MTRNMEFNARNISFYFLGFFVLGFGVNAMLISNFGAGPWDTVTKNLSTLVGLSLGTTSFIIAFILMAVVLGYTRKWKLLLMIFPILLVSVSLDFWDLVIFKDFSVELIYLRTIFYLSGVVGISLGLALIISSKFPAFVFDELMIMMMSILKTDKLAAIRVGIEVLGISLGTLFGFLAGVGFGAVGIGSLLMALVLGPTLSFFVKVLGGAGNDEAKDAV